MNPLRKKRLIIILAVLVGVGAAVALALSALQQNINLFYTPTQIANGEAPLDTRIRAGGMVQAGSLKRSGDSLDVEFVDYFIKELATDERSEHTNQTTDH